MANTTKPAFDPWDVKVIEARAADAASVTAARKLLKDRDAFGKVEPRADGLGWWAVCKGMTGTYQVSVKRGPRGGLHDDCTCPSYKKPCKHALALLIYLAEHPEARPEPDAPKDAPPADLEPLLRAAFADPDDDLRRLVLADFVEEQGDADRAALIRVQCELRRGAEGSSLQESKAQEEKLVAAIRKRFHPLPDGLTLKFDRGFMRLNLGWGRFANPGALPGRFLDLFREGWVESVKFDGWYDAISRDAIPFFRQVGELDFRSMQLDAQVLIAVAADLTPGQEGSRLARVLVPKRYERRFAELIARRGEEAAATPARAEETPPALPILPTNQLHNGITAARITLLAREGHLRSVRNLALHHGLGDDGAATLARTNEVRHLLSLSLREVDVGPDGLAALAASKVLTRLESLLILRTPIGDAGAKALAANLALPRLRVLTVQDAEVGDDGANALAKSAGLADAQAIELSDNAVGPDGLAAVLRSKTLRGLKSLSLSGNPIPVSVQVPAVVGALGRTSLSVAFSELKVSRQPAEADEAAWDVTLTGTGESIPAGALDSLPGSPSAGRIHSLTLTRMRFVPDDMVRLADVVARLPIRELHLPHNQLRNDAVQALAERLDALSLDVLDLAHNEVGVAGGKALASASGLNKVRELNLSHNPLRSSGLDALAASESRSALRRLIVRGIDCDGSQRQALRQALGRKVRVEF